MQLTFDDDGDFQSSVLEISDDADGRLVCHFLLLLFYDSVIRGKEGEEAQCDNCDEDHHQYSLQFVLKFYEAYHAHFLLNAEQ